LANEIVTKVLGTSFTVRSFDKDSIIQVTVRTGNVSVYSQANTRIAETTLPNQLGGIILTPNQELVYKRSNREFKKTLLQNPIVITPAVDEKIMLYDDTPIEKVFAQLSRIYGINIVYDDDLLKKCAVTADLRNEVFYRKLDLICKAIGATYEIIDGQVVVQSNGCQ
jgi:ferric-dicitrate binding protein FerR (iron transport regulator)